MYKGICESINTIVYVVVKKGWRNQAAGFAGKEADVPLKVEERTGIIGLLYWNAVFLMLQKE